MPVRFSLAPGLLTALALVSLQLLGCSFGESGVEPPLDRIFLPGAMAADPGGRWLYVVNSNSDLRFNAGTVVALDLDKAAETRRRSDWPDCPSAGHVGEDDGTNPACCRDYFDRRVLNCDERAHVDRNATVRLGSFGSRAAIQKIENRPDLPGITGRLFISVRSEPSVTYIDLTSGPQGAGMSCTSGGERNGLCDDAHKIRGDISNAAVSALKLQEEPNALALDADRQLLHVGHLIQGLSTIDLCPKVPELRWWSSSLFSPEPAAFGVTSLFLQRSATGAPGALLATARVFDDRLPGEVVGLKVRGQSGCPVGGGPREVDLVESERFFTSALYPFGNDVRGVVENADGTRAYMLNRNAAFSRAHPPVVTEVDRSVDATGARRNRALALVETCAGATELHLHDAGRGPRLYVVCFEAGQIYVLDPLPLAVTAVINVGRGPSTMVIPPGQKSLAYVSGFSDNNVSVIDLDPTGPTENRVIQRLGFPQLRKR